jgi:hypothetical protein
MPLHEDRLQRPRFDFAQIISVVHHGQCAQPSILDVIEPLHGCNANSIGACQRNVCQSCQEDQIVFPTTPGSPDDANDEDESDNEA